MSVFKRFRAFLTGKKAEPGRGAVPEDEEETVNPFSELQLLHNHSNIVRHLTRIDDTRFASGDDDGMIAIWSTGGVLLGTLSGHTRAVNALLVRPSGAGRRPSGGSSSHADREPAESGSAAGDAIDGPAGGGGGDGPADDDNNFGMRRRADDVDDAVVEPAAFLTAGGSDGSAAEPDDDPTLLISCSSDKTIRVWNAGSYECLRVLTLHTGSVTCLAFLHNSFDMVCSGGNDRYLQVWSLVDADRPAERIDRLEEANMHCMVSLPGNLIVVGSNSPELCVYDVNAMDIVTKLPAHRESVRCLAPLNRDLFASSSLNGGIIIWVTESLSELRHLNFQEFCEQVGDNSYSYHRRIESWTVRHLLPLNRRFLAACIANGFAVYDALTGACVVHISQAHESAVQHMIALDGGARLLTCAADGTIRVWRLVDVDLNPAYDDDDEASTPSFSTTPLFGSRAARPASPVLLGELYGHSDAVQALLVLEESASFASCGSDAAVILWKDGAVEQEIRNHIASLSLLHHAGTDDRREDNINRFLDELAESGPGRDAEGSRSGEDPDDAIGSGGGGAGAATDDDDDDDDDNSSLAMHSARSTESLSGDAVSANDDLSRDGDSQ